MAEFPQDLLNDEPNHAIGFAFGLLEKQVEKTKDYKEKVDPKGGLIGIHFLPLPANIEDSSSHDWERKEGLGSQMINKGAAALGSAVGSKSNILAGGVDIIKTAADVNGFKTDPNYTYVYQGSAPRSFNYSVNMIPRNAGEASAIQTIIKDFKKYSSPEKSSTNIRNSYWQIEIINLKLKEMTKFDAKAWALTSVTTNYTGAGSALFFEDGMPKQINLSLVFQEIETIYREDW